MTDPTFYRLPTADEVLAGDTQAGVPRPTFDFDSLPQPQLAVRTSWWKRFLALFGKVVR